MLAARRTALKSPASESRERTPVALRLLFVLSILVAGCGLPWSNERVGGPRGGVRIARVARGDLSGVLLYAGDLRPKQGATVSARVTGRLERLYVEPGSRVREGDTLAELDRAALEVQVVQNQANLAAAEARLAGLQAGDGPDERAEAEARLRAARARLASLESGPRAETVPELAQSLREARRRLAELESNNAESIAQAEARLAAARGRLDQLLTAAAEYLASPKPLPRVAIEQARAEIRRAEEDLARARRPVTSEEVAGARLEVARA